MNPEPPLENLLEALGAVQKVIEALAHHGFIIGGVAVSLLSQPRYTGDVDAIVMVDTSDLPHLLEMVAKYDLTPRIQNVEEFVSQTRVLPLRHRETQVGVDLSFGVLPFEVEAQARSQMIDVGPFSVRVVSPEDLIILKAIAGRPKDWADIQTVAETYPELDRERIRYWIQEFAELMEIPELWETTEPLLSS